MARAYRWAYMAQPNYNPPNDTCPECKTPSKTYFMGGSTVDGVAIYKWACEHDHRWEVREKREL